MKGDTGLRPVGRDIGKCLWSNHYFVPLGPVGFDMVSMVIRHTLGQVATPDAMRGRVSAINWVFIGASNGADAGAWSIDDCRFTAVFV